MKKLVSIILVTLSVFLLFSCKSENPKVHEKIVEFIANLYKDEEKVDFTSDFDREKDEEKVNFTSDFDVEKVSAKLLEAEPLADGIVYTDESSPSISDVFAIYFGIEFPADDISSCIFITSSDAHVSEAAIFKVTNKETADALLKAFHERQKNLIQIHTNYDQNDLSISENLDMGSFDDVVYYTATDSNKDIVDIIKNTK